MILERALSDGTVTLKPLDRSAAHGPYDKWMRDPEILRFLESRFIEHDPDSLAAFIDASNQSDTSLLTGIYFDNSHVGNIRLHLIPEHGRGEIGLLIGDKSAWGKGIARQAIALISEYAFSVLGLVKLCAGCYATNIGSLRAFQAAGYKQEAIRSLHYFDQGQSVDAVYLARFNPQGNMPE